MGGPVSSLKIVILTSSGRIACWWLLPSGAADAQVTEGAQWRQFASESGTMLLGVSSSPGVAPAGGWSSVGGAAVLQNPSDPISRMSSEERCCGRALERDENML